MNGSAPHDPPFRAEHIGSLLRPPSLLAARREHRAGSLGAEELRAAEDAAIADVARLQAELGLGSITDGEFRRESYSDSFTTAGFESVGVGDGGDGGWSYADSTGNQEEGRVAVVGGRLLWSQPVNVENFKYLAAVAPAGVPKMTLPGPCYLHFRAGRDNISRAGVPAHNSPRLTLFFWVSRAPAASMAPPSTTASSSTLAPMPTSAPSSRVQACSRARCPMVTSSPI